MKPHTTVASTTPPGPTVRLARGVLFIKTQNTNGQDTFAYYHHDHLGTPIQATDKAGRVVWAASYTPFGKATITTPQATADKPTVTSNLRLPGQYEDTETGLHYNWHRYYDPQTGRYVTEDPIGLAGGMNTYAYANGAPISFTDPKGLVSWSGTMGGVAVVDGLGAGFFGFDLTSECKCGKKVHIKGYVSTVAAGLGFKFTGSGSAASFTDIFECPRADAANGLAGLVSVNSVVGGGFSYGSARLGWLTAGAISLSGPAYGLDISAGVYVGTSVVTSVEVTDCDDCKK